MLTLAEECTLKYNYEFYIIRVSHKTEEVESDIVHFSARKKKLQFVYL